MRARDHGIEIGLLPPGPYGAITDVPGVGVGHASHGSDHTGVTAVVPALGRDLFLSPYFAGAAAVYGVGEYAGITQIEEWGIAETPVFLTGTPYVGHVYAGATAVLTARQARIGRAGDGDVIIPVVAECDPSTYCDVREGPAPDEALVRAALDGACGGPVQEGQVGAGIGMSGFGWAGGIGTASRRAGEHTVGVLLLVNFGDPERLCVDGVPVGRMLARDGAPPVEGSCFCLVATDAPLLPNQLERLARRPFLGLARTGSYAGNGSGEVAIAFSTANAEALGRDALEPVQQLAMLRNEQLNPLFAATVEAAEEAVLNALFAGRDLDGATGERLPAAPAEQIARLVRDRR
jgi:D-aminopeptidase